MHVNNVSNVNTDREFKSHHAQTVNVWGWGAILGVHPVV